MSNKLIHYLHSGVKVQLPISGNIKDLNSSNINTIQSVDKPLLYPLSALTETIIHEGKEEIPLVELAKIEGLIDEHSDTELISDRLHFLRFEFYYECNSFLIYHYGTEVYYDVENQLSLFLYCFSRRINLFPDEIKSIDPRGLGEFNPYNF